MNSNNCFFNKIKLCNNNSFNRNSTQTKCKFNNSINNNHNNNYNNTNLNSNSLSNLKVTLEIIAVPSIT